MKSIQVTKYISFDGKTFDDQISCIEYEFKQKKIQTMQTTTSWHTSFYDKSAQRWQELDVFDTGKDAYAHLKKIQSKYPYTDCVVQRKTIETYDWDKIPKV